MHVCIVATLAIAVRYAVRYATRPLSRKRSIENNHVNVNIAMTLKRLADRSVYLRSYLVYYNKT